MSGQIAEVRQYTFFAPTTPPPRIADAIIDAEFEEAFWPQWQKKMRRENNPKKLALASFRRARRTASLAEILSGLARSVASPDPTMRPMAATWINQERWRDEPGPDLSADPWGVDAFREALTDNGTLSALSYETEALYAVLVATGWPVTWRGSLDLINAWLAAGYTPDGIAGTIAGAVAEHGTRSSLKLFDGIVRARAVRIDL